MKIRNGFVSNSSSSSYIIVVKKNNPPCSHCGRKDPDFLKLLGESCSSDNRIKAGGYEAVLEHIRNERQGWMTEKQYKTLEKEVQFYKDSEDEILASIEISNHDEETKRLFTNMVDSNIIKILYDSES